MSELTCSDVEALAAELALGILSGGERADALRHLNSCPACQHEVESLSLVADELLLAAPEHEPPIGFDGRVMDRVAAERESALGSPPPTPATGAPGRRLTPRWRRSLLLAAAAVLLVVAALGGLVVGRRSNGTHIGRTTAQVTTVSYGAGHWTCQVAAFPGQAGRPTELVIHLDEPASANGWYTVEAEPASGATPVPVGTITVVDGTGMLNTTVPRGTGKVQAIRVLSPAGELHYRAAFPPV
jgi:hypothetical protein